MIRPHYLWMGLQLAAGAFTLLAWLVLMFMALCVLTEGWR